LGKTKDQKKSKRPVKEIIDELRKYVDKADQPLFEFPKVGRPKKKKQYRLCKACGKWFEKKPKQSKNIKSCSQECLKKLRVRNVDWAVNGHRMRQKKRGRHTVMSDEVVKMLEQIFALGGTDQEACLYAGISQATLITYQHKNPEFIERKKLLKQKPVLMARMEVVKGLANDKEFSFRFLERRRRDEFGPVTGNNSVNVSVADQITNNTLKVDPMFQKLPSDRAVSVLKELRGENITNDQVKRAKNIIDLEDPEIDDDFLDDEG